MPAVMNAVSDALNFAGAPTVEMRDGKGVAGFGELRRVWLNAAVLFCRDCQLGCRSVMAGTVRIRARRLKRVDAEVPTHRGGDDHVRAKWLSGVR